METRRRFFRAMAAASAAALVGALGTGSTVAGVASAAEPGAGVTFTSQPAVADLVAHYTVSRSDRPEDTSTSSSGDDRQLPRLSKRDHDTAGQGLAVSTSSNTSEGPKSDNTTADFSTSSSSRRSSLSNSSERGGGNRAKASFIGQQASATTCPYFGPGCNPPDMALAASPRFVLQGVNSQFEVLDTSGRVQPGWPVGAPAFFGVPNVTNADGEPCDVAHKSQPFMSDPRALYDPIDHRFWAAMLQVENGLGIAADCPFKSVYYIAVSQTADPRGDWNVYEFNMSLDGVFAADFTMIGFNRDALTFSANMFGPPEGLNGGFYTELFEANKAKMERGEGDFTANGFFNLQAQGPGVTATTGPFLADTPQPALNLDGSGGSGAVFVDLVNGPDLVNGHFCSSAADSCSGLILWRMTNPTGHDSDGEAPVLTGTYVPSKPFVFNRPADQPSCNRCVDANANDLRISATTVVRNGILYGAFGTALNNGTQTVPGIEWLQISLSDSENGNSANRDSGNAVSARTGYYNFSGDAAASYGALMPDGHGNVVMLFEHMSHTVFPETRYIVKRTDGQFHGLGTLLKAGENSYRPQLCGTLVAPPPAPPRHVVCRWGDYSATSFDGAGGIWFAGEYANHLNLGPPQNGRNWGTWIGAINAS